MTSRQEAISKPVFSSAEASRCYVRFAALGDSVTYGVGDSPSGRCRGWARIMADAMGTEWDVSFCNTARPGATAADVRAKQLQDAVTHRPTIASLIVGLNDTMRSTWDPAQLRADLLCCAEQLAGQGALLLTVRFHDHTRLLPLPRFLAVRMRSRISVLNEVYDEIHARFGGLQVDLAAHPAIHDHDFWSVDRLHPSELGHRALANEFAEKLREAGLDFRSPGLQLDGHVPGQIENLRWLVTQGTPWIARRTRDLAPAAARTWLLSMKTSRHRRPSRAAAGDIGREGLRDLIRAGALGRRQTRRRLAHGDQVRLDPRVLAGECVVGVA